MRPQYITISWLCSKLMKKKENTMKNNISMHRYLLLSLLLILFASSSAAAQDALPSWNDGPAKKAIVEFVAAVTDEKGRDYVEPAKSMARGSTRPYTQDSMTRGMLVLVPNISTIPS